MLPADGLAGSVTVIAADVVLTGYARPATAVKDAVWTDCHAREPPYALDNMPAVLAPCAMTDMLREMVICYPSLS